MDIEKLTKQQIILVTLLVSFVTSIATGIVTVALIDQAPPGVTQTINRVVERTVERVVTPPENNAAAVVTRETIIVKEDDKIVEAVDKNKNSIVRIYTDVSDADKRILIGLGTIVSKDGLIATGEAFADSRGRYVVTVDGSIFHKVSVLEKKPDQKIYFLKVDQDEQNIVNFTPVTFTDSNSLKLGQTIIVLGGNERDIISTGIVSSLIEGKINNATSTETVGLTTNTPLSQSTFGGPLLNLNGEVVGLRVSQNVSDKYDFASANLLRQQISSI
jgi:S1-C subfamily serine protease